MIAFPDIDPVAIQLGPLAVRWYGLAYVAAFLLCILGIKYRARHRPCPIAPQQTDDLIFYGALGVVLGGRIGYCLFYQPAQLLSDPLSLFKVWEGGMSFHGGLIGTALAIYLYSRKIDRNFFDLVDLIALFAPIGLFFGRIANFVNGELYGRVTDVPWGMVFPGAPGEVRHPSQLYEALLEGVLMFAILQWFGRKPFPRGAAIGLFVLVYGVLRFIVEFFRQPDAHIQFDLMGWMTRGQILCLPMIAVGAGVLWWAYRRRVYPDFPPPAGAEQAVRS